MKEYVIKEDRINKDIIIQTYDVEAMPWHGDYETCISFNNGESYKIIAEHKTKEEALIYHNKYLKELKNIK